MLKNLKFNNGSNHDWDICYENTSGLKTYLYSEDKLHLEQEKKFKLVQKFSENIESPTSTPVVPLSPKTLSRELKLTPFSIIPPSLDHITFLPF